MIAAVQSPLEIIADAMRRLGAVRIVFKLLANNDNSKQQVYFGGDFDVLRMIPHGELSGSFSSADGPVFKASLNLKWLHPSLLGQPEPAPGAQLIFYPRYPEVRMSGFLRNCRTAPSELMRPPTAEERLEREGTPRCLVLGICPDDSVLAYVAPWGNAVVQDAVGRIGGRSVANVASVFFELAAQRVDPEAALLKRLREIKDLGFIRSCRLDASGSLVPYAARNGAGYTLESLFGITPNGQSEPDFMGWELKAHAGQVVTLMTPEPDAGIYRDSLDTFLLGYGRCGSERRDFTGRHQVGVDHDKRPLTLRMEGFDRARCEISDPEGGLALRDQSGRLAAGWTFNKLVTHWSRKHSQTAFITYSKHESVEGVYYRYGPEAMLCNGAGLNEFLAALYDGVVYYDPGINQKLVDAKWKSKKRNQFRVKWSDVSGLYGRVRRVAL